MSAILIQLRSELSRRKAAIISLMLLAGVTAGFVMAAAGGARRTETAYPRFVVANDGFHAFTGGGLEGDEFDRAIEVIRDMPGVKDMTTAVVVGPQITVPARGALAERVLTFPDAIVVADPDGRSLYELNRAKVLEGRIPNRSRPDEVSVPFVIAERQDIRVGDILKVGAGIDRRNFTPVRQQQVRVVGIHAAPNEFEAVGQVGFFALWATPAFYEKHSDVIPPKVADLWSQAIYLDDPSSAVAFKQRVESELKLDVPIVEPVMTRAVQETLRLYASSLWLLAAVIALAGIAVVGQALARFVALEGVDYPVLRALGFSRRMLVGLTLLRAGVLGLGAGLLGAVVAFVLSPLAPIGPARLAEPAPGFGLDLVVLGFGLAGLLIVVLVASAIPAWRAAQSRGLTPVQHLHQRPSRVVGLAARAGGSPAIVSGLRLALEPGRGSTAVPVRSTIATVAIAVAAAVAASSMGASLDHLLATPALSGYTYDAIVPVESSEPAATTQARIERVPSVRAASLGTGFNAIFDGVDSFIVAFDEGKEIRFAVMDGRSPTSAAGDGIPEIALGPATASRMGASPGDIITFLRSQETRDEGRRVPQRARVVGTAAIPALPWGATAPGEGGVMTSTAVEMLDPENSAGCCFVLFDPGTDLAKAKASMEEAGFPVFMRQKRADLRTLENITGLPLLLSAICAAMAIAALAHVLITGIRRRRRDLAILKTLGFVRKQIRSTVAWQASITALLCGIVGVPLGVVLGRTGWTAVAQRFGVVPVFVTPVVVLLLAIPIVIAFANVVAALPARSAVRTRSAVVLRTD